MSVWPLNSPHAIAATGTQLSPCTHQRWGIEEDYKVMKSRLTIENFSGFSVEAVLQDIHAKTLTKNLAAVAIIEADRLSSQVEPEAQTSLQT